MAPPQQRWIGGSKGHIEEVVEGQAVLQLLDKYRWKMIPNCTGRYTCRDHDAVATLSPTALLVAAGITHNSNSSSNNTNFPCYTFPRNDRPDMVLVIPLDDELATGIISYQKPATVDDDSSSSPRPSQPQHVYVHTLNTKSGFQRKLHAMGIHLHDTKD